MGFLVPKKTILAPKPKKSRQNFATVEFKPSVHEHFQRKERKISNLESRNTSTHGGETEQTNLPQKFAMIEGWNSKHL